MWFVCRKDIDYFCVMHVTGNGLFSQSKGRPESDSRQKLKCSEVLNEKILQLRKDFSSHDDTKMLVMLSIYTNDMTRYVSMHPEVWFIDCTSGVTEYTNLILFICIYVFVYSNFYMTYGLYIPVHRYSPWNSTLLLFFPFTLSRHQSSKETIVCYGCLYSKRKNISWQFGNYTF